MSERINLLVGVDKEVELEDKLPGDTEKDPEKDPEEVDGGIEAYEADGEIERWENDGSVTPAGIPEDEASTDFFFDDVADKGFA